MDNDDDVCYNCSHTRVIHVFPMFDGGVQYSNTACGSCDCDEFEDD